MSNLKFTDLDAAERAIIREALAVLIADRKIKRDIDGCEDHDRKALDAVEELRDFLEVEGAL